MAQIPLKRTDYNVSDEFTEEECLQFANDVKTEATRQLNEFVRNQYTETGIGRLIEDRLSQFIRLGANINNTEHEDGNTPLISATLDENNEMVNMLLFHGADITGKNDDGLNVFEVMSCIERETGETFSERIKQSLISAFYTKNSTN
jgi:ankyrin repeat protein